MSNDTLTFEQQDEFNRGPIADRLIQLLEDKINAFPMLLHGPWGSGKSAFCAKLVARIAEKPQGKIRAVIFDAFKADHHDNPLMSLYASLEPLFPKDDQSGLQKVAMPVLRTSLNVIGRLSIGMLLKQVGLTQEELKEVTQGSQELLEQGIKAALDDQIQAEHNIQQFKMKLEALAGDNTLLVIVDELDRCRPSYAVAILETIKHIFDCKNVKFLLVANKEQLQASIQHAYGAAVDAADYLEKFFAYQLSLPPVMNHNSSYGNPEHNTSAMHFMRLIRSSSTLNASFLGVSGSGEQLLLQHLIFRHKLSLRSIEKLAIRFEVLISTFPNQDNHQNEYALNLARITAVMISHFKPELATDILSGKNSDEPLLDFLQIDTIPSDIRQVDATNLIAICLFADTPTALLKKFNVPQTSGYPEFWKNVRKEYISTSWSFSGTSVFLKEIRRYIAMTNFLQI